MTDKQKVYLSIVIVFLAVIFLPPIMGELILKMAKREKATAEKVMEYQPHVLIVEIDGCQYLDNLIYNGHNVKPNHVYTHRGCCKNQIHYQK